MTAFTVAIVRIAYAILPSFDAAGDGTSAVTPELDDASESESRLTGYPGLESGVW